MESAAALMPPSTGLYCLLLSAEPGTEYENIVNLRSKFVFMLGGIIPLIHYQEPVCISYQINLIL